MRYKEYFIDSFDLYYLAFPQAYICLLAKEKKLQGLNGLMLTREQTR
jgi:hypothetical protein